MLTTPDQQISPTDPNARSNLRCCGLQCPGRRRGGWSPNLWRGRATYPEVLETARDASKATPEVACRCELCFDRLPRAVRSG
jgi:hypothetical protein